MDYGKYCFDGSKRFTLAAVQMDGENEDKKAGQRRLAENREKIRQLQDRLYAQGNQSLLVIFQAMDAAGKDGTINHVFSGANPEGIQVTSFKTPSQDELGHDYLWRVYRAVPPYGTIGVFNRSHYEEVLIGKVLNLPKDQNRRVSGGRDLWNYRYRQMNDFERHLTENGYTVLKFFLQVSKDVQYERFMARLDDPGKNWKFAASDLDTRALWDEYMEAYRDCINATATAYAPWYTIPADKKWFMRLLVSEIVADTLEKMKPDYPELSGREKEELEYCRDRLEREEITQNPSE